MSEFKLGGCWQELFDQGFVETYHSKNRIVRALLPTYFLQVDVNSKEGTEDCPMFTIRALEETVHSIINKEVLRFDGIPEEVFKLMSHHQPDLLLCAFIDCLKKAILPTELTLSSR